MTGRCGVEERCRDRRRLRHRAGRRASTARRRHDVAILDLNPSDAEHSYVADVTDRAQVDAALNAMRAKLGPVTVLVNAAGLEKFKRFTDISFEEWQRVVDVNLNGVFHCIQAVLPDMIEAGWGRIVNISSSSTHSGQPYMSPVCGGEVGGQRTHQVARP